LFTLLCGEFLVEMATIVRQGFTTSRRDPGGEAGDAGCVAADRGALGRIGDGGRQFTRDAHRGIERAFEIASTDGGAFAATEQ
jgi:hypothetical protein